MTDFNEANFLEHLVKTFPQISEDVLDEDYEGLLPLQVGFFTRFTQRAIDANDIKLVKRCFEFVDAEIQSANSKVENVLYVTFLGKLFIPEGSSIEKLLPDYLKAAYDDLKAYHAAASKDQKLNDFFKSIE